MTDLSLSDAVQRALTRILTLRLVGTNNIGLLRSFYFGELDLREGKRIAPFVLDLLCAWRLEKKGRILTGQDDISQRATTNTDPKWNPGDDWGHLQDEALIELLGERHPEFGIVVANKVHLVAETVTTEPLGGFRLRLSGDLALVAFPTHSVEEDWRLVTPEGERHFVVGGGAIL